MTLSLEKLFIDTGYNLIHINCSTYRNATTGVKEETTILPRHPELFEQMLISTVKYASLYKDLNS